MPIFIRVYRTHNRNHPIPRSFSVAYCVRECEDRLDINIHTQAIFTFTDLLVHLVSGTRYMIWPARVLCNGCPLVCFACLPACLKLTLYNAVGSTYTYVRYPSTSGKCPFSLTTRITSSEKTPFCRCSYVRVISSKFAGVPQYWKTRWFPSDTEISMFF